jgi:hypothetical protein
MVKGEQKIELYTKMCTKAEEIQEEWIPNVGDHFFDPRFNYKNRMITNLNQAEAFRNCEHLKKAVVWLPSLSQLLDIYAKDATYHHACFTLRDFNYFIDAKLTEYHNYGLLFSRIEELALIFVMSQVFNKRIFAVTNEVVFNVNADVCGTKRVSSDVLAIIERDSIIDVSWVKVGKQ